MVKQFTEDLKIKSVKYYNKINNYTKTCEIFECTQRSLKRWVEKYKLNNNVERKERISKSYKLLKIHIDFIKDLKCDFIMISLPWCTYESDEWFEDWKHRRPDEHIYHFDEISLENFMKENGYQLINFTNIEDTIRKSNNKKNILTGVFKKNVDK